MDAYGAFRDAHCRADSGQVLHRDLKSLNFLVDENDVVKICDFGLSREEVDSNKSTLAKMRGTFAYNAPECTDTILGNRSDRFAER